MIIVDNDDILIRRLEIPKNHRLSLMSDIYVERGTQEDWELLHELHYKAENLGVGPTFYRCMLNGRVIGVGVMTVNKMLSAGRNELFERYLRPNYDGMDTKVINTHRARWINKHMTQNSRLVLDTMYRGAGIAYRMQNIMLRMTGERFIEFQSSMSKFNPFATKAGVLFVKPKRSANYERGLAWFRRWFESIPTDVVGILAELEAMPAPVKEKCVREMRKFYYDSSAQEKSGNNRRNGTSRVENLKVSDLLKNLQQLVFASPLYGIYINPDYDLENDKPFELPDRIPLMAFDNQRTDERLDISKL